MEVLSAQDPRPSSSFSALYIMSKTNESPANKQRYHIFSVSWMFAFHYCAFIFLPQDFPWKKKKEEENEAQDNSRELVSLVSCTASGSGWGFRDQGSVSVYTANTEALDQDRPGLTS